MNKKRNLLLGSSIFVIFFFFLSIVSCTTVESQTEDFLSYDGDEFPKPIGYVNDYIDVITQDLEDMILAETQKVKDQSDDNIIVVTIESLGGKSIDDYSLDLYRAWGLGRNSVLLLIAMQEGKAHISAGKDTGKIISYETSIDILNDIIVPEFSRGDFGEGIYQGVKVISNYILSK